MRKVVEDVEIVKIVETVETVEIVEAMEVVNSAHSSRLTELLAWPDNSSQIFTRGRRELPEANGWFFP